MTRPVAPSSRSLLSTLSLVAVVGATGCKISTSGLTPFKNTSGGPTAAATAAGPSGSAPTSTAEVVPVKSDCPEERRSPEEIADGVIPPPCGDNDEGYETWKRTKRFVRPKVEPLPGRARVGRFRASWCKGVYDSDTASSLAQYTVDARDADEWHSPLTSVRRASHGLCVDPDDPRFQDLAGAYVQTLVNFTGGSVDAVSDYLASWHDPDARDREISELCAAVQVDAPVQTQVTVRQVASLLPCPPPSHITGALWYVDRSPALTQLEQLARLNDALKLDEPNDVTLTVYASLRPELALVDESKLRAELLADSWGPTARAEIALSYAQFKTRAARHEVALQKLVGKDPDLRAILIDAPANGWRAWHEAYQAHPADVDAARAYEALYTGDRKSAKRGCRADATKRFYGYVATRGGKTTDELLAVARDPIGGVLAEYLRSCLDSEGDEEGAALIGTIVQGKHRRGPRFAVIDAMATALVAALADRDQIAAVNLAGLDMQVPDLSGQFPFSHARGEASGVVAAVETSGDRVIARFKTERWLEDEIECHETNRINAFRPDGTVIYRQNCRATGNKVTRTSKVDSVSIPKDLAAGIKPGVFLNYSAATNRTGDGVWLGAATEVYTDKGQTKLIAAYGMLAK